MTINTIEDKKETSNNTITPLGQMPLNGVETQEKKTLGRPKVATELSKETPIKTDDFIKIPKELENLKLRKVKKLSVQDVKIDNLLNYQSKLHLPRHTQDELDREGYTVLYPLNREDKLNDLMERGAEFVLNDDGSMITISAGQSNEKGELEYHIAMKIKNELLERERELMCRKEQQKKQDIETGKTDLGGALNVSSMHMKTMDNSDNKL